jgi:hypothetical protein
MGDWSKKISSPIAPTRSGCRTPCAAEPCRSFGRSPGAGRGACCGRVFHPGDYRSLFRFEQEIVDKFGNSACRVSPRQERRSQAAPVGQMRATAPCLAFARASPTEAGEARSHRRTGRGADPTGRGADPPAANVAPSSPCSPSAVAARPEGGCFADGRALKAASRRRK